MTAVRLPPFPVVPETFRQSLSKALELRFHCNGGPSPGAQAIGPGRFAFGCGTDWSIQLHALQIECRLTAPSVLESLFGSNGVACESAGIWLVLEWTSPKSSKRGLSSAHVILRDLLPNMADISLCMEFKAGELLGDMQLTLQAFVGRPGTPIESERHLANEIGLRLGALSETWELTFDGNGSLFPITQVAHLATDPLWKLVTEDWEDATFDEFSQEFVALEVNEAHPSFRELYGTPEAPYSTSLFRQVIASWLLLFFSALKERTQDQEIDPAAGDGVMQWDAIIDQSGRHAAQLLPGSIAKAASEFSSRGDLDFTSDSAFMQSAQMWIDRRLGGD